MISFVLNRVAQAAGVLLGRLTPEMAVMLARDVLRANKAFARNSGYLAFVRDHGSLLV